MSFEPKVLESIEQYRKSTSRDRLKLMTPFILAVLLALLLLIGTLVLHGRISDAFGGAGDSYWLSQASLFIKVVAGAASVLLIAGLGYNVYAASRYARARFELFIESQTVDFDPMSANKFLGALDGAAIGAGVQAPCMLVLDDPAANAAAFETDGGVRGVAVTAGMLEADISVSEANSVMAHELAHLVIGENIRAPVITDLEFMPGLLLIAFGTLAIAAVLAAPSDIRYVLFEVIVVVVGMAALILIYRSEPFIVKLLNLTHQHDDLLADSLAVKITKDPSSMKSAIRKVEALARKTDRVPGGSILSRYLFVTPPTRPGDYYRFATTAAGKMLTGRKQPRTWMLFTRPASKAMMRLLEMESRMTAERVTNLEFIEQGRWRALEDWSRD